MFVNNNMSLPISQLGVFYYVAENPSILLNENEKTISDSKLLKSIIEEKVSNFIRDNVEICLATAGTAEKDIVIKALNQLSSFCPTSNKILGLIHQLRFQEPKAQKHKALIEKQPRDILLQQLLLAMENKSDFFHLSILNKNFNAFTKDSRIIGNLFKQPIGSFGKKAIQFLKNVSEKNADLKKESFELDFTSCRDLDDQDLITLGEIAPYLNLRSISIPSYPSISFSGICSLIEKCPNLQSIKCAANADVLEHLAKHCKNLKGIEIISKSNYRANLENLALLPHLETIVIPSDNRTFDEAAKQGKWTHLKSFKFSGSDRCLLDHETSLALLKASDQINSFDFGISSNAEFIELLPYLKNLESIYFPNNDLSLDAAKLLEKNCRKLKEIIISNSATYPGDLFMSEFIDNLPSSIESVCLWNTDDKQLKTLAERCPNLKKIQLKAPNCSDEGIKFLATKCTNLKSVNLLNGCNKRITDEAIEALAQHCKGITSLSFDTSSIITLKCLIEVGKNLPDLRLLQINSYKHSVATKSIVDPGLRSLAKNCNKLEEIELTKECQGEALTELIKVNPRLKTATIYDTSDETLTALADGCPRLKYLRMKTPYWEPIVKKETLEKFWKQCPSISVIVNDSGKLINLINEGFLCIRND